MKTWRDKAHREIARLCFAEWKKLNVKKDGTKYCRHRPYNVPEVAERLVECLNTNDEETAKTIFVWELV